MGKRNPREWRVEQRIDPDLIVPEEVYEKNARNRMEKERAIYDAINALSYRSSNGASYTRNAQSARDGKGSVRGNQVKARNHYPKRRLLAGALAAVAIFGATYQLATDDTPKSTSTAVVEEYGVSANELGLTPEIVQKLKENEEFFEQYDQEKGITEEEVLSKIEEIKKLKDEILSSKFGALFEVPASEVQKGRVAYDSDGQLSCTIRVGDDIVLRNNLFPIFKKADMSRDIQDLLVLFDSIDNLYGKVQSDQITKNKAISRLGEKYFEPLEIIANSEFIRDKNNNITVLYTRINEANKQAAEEEKQQADSKNKEDDGMEIGD